MYDRKLLFNFTKEVDFVFGLPNTIKKMSGACSAIGINVPWLSGIYLCQSRETG